MAYPAAAVAGLVSRAAGRKPAQPAKPVLKPDVIQSAMDKRPRLNANMRRAPAKPGDMNETPGINPGAPGKPAWQQLRERGVAGTGSAAGNRAALAAAGPQAQTDILTSPPPPGPGGVMGAELPPPKGPFAGGPPPGLPYGVGGADPAGGTFNELPMDATGGMDPNGAPPPGVFPAPSGSQNPMFSANLPPQIMQRLQALQAGRGGAGAVGGQGAPGAQPPGAPAAGPALPDFYQSPSFVPPRAGRSVSTFDRRTMA